MPSRINKCIELLDRGQPIYFTTVDQGGFENGRKAAITWADYINYDMEHLPFDVVELLNFMHGLVAGGPTTSGHRTPSVIVSMPMDGSDETIVRANAWMIRQVLATGVHGLMLCHAESPAAVRAFVESVRYSFAGGRRGTGGQAQACQVWGVGASDYLRRADPWPLNADGELLLGLKIENVRALANVEASTAVPGIAFVEWGPGDMAMSMGIAEPGDPPYPSEMQAARARVLEACKVNSLAFMDNVTPENVVEQISEGVMVGSGNMAEAAQIGRRHVRTVLQ